jgi:hypothetical protein
MRRGLAITTEALDRQRILQVAEASRNHLRDPWLIDQSEEHELRQAGFLMIDPPSKADISATEDGLIVRGGWRTALGKALRSKDVWGEPLPVKEYSEVILQVKVRHPQLSRILRNVWKFACDRAQQHQQFAFGQAGQFGL